MPLSTAPPQELSATLAVLYVSYCKRLKVDKNWRRQFLILFLSALYWPMYTRAKHWTPPLTSTFFKEVLAKSVALSDIEDTNPRIQRFVKRASQCGFQSIVEEDVRYGSISVLYLINSVDASCAAHISRSRTISAGLFCPQEAFF